MLARRLYASRKNLSLRKLLQKFHTSKSEVFLIMKKLIQIFHFIHFIQSGPCVDLKNVKLSVWNFFVSYSNIVFQTARKSPFLSKIHWGSRCPESVYSRARSLHAPVLARFEVRTCSHNEPTQKIVTVLQPGIL